MTGHETAAMKKKVLTSIGVLGVTAIWGLSFPIMKNAMTEMTTLWLLAVRFTVASILLLAWQGRKLRGLGKKGLAVAFKLGGLLAMAYITQNVGLSYTTASNAAVITGFYVVLVPLLGWFATRKLHISQIIIAVIAFLALAVFSLDQELRIVGGDVWVLGGAVSYALHILMLDKYTKEYESMLLVAMQISAATVILIISALTLAPVPDFSGLSVNFWGAIAYTAILATMLGFGAQTAAQKVLPPATASVLFTAESLFGALFGVLLLNESFMLRQILGGLALILCMVAAVLDADSVRNVWQRISRKSSSRHPA